MIHSPPPTTPNAPHLSLPGPLRHASERAIFLAILVAGFLLRLYQLTSPLYDRQAWRQTDTAEIARNFYLHGMNLFYPQVGWGGPLGYCETEFPLFNYLAACLYQVAGGPYDWLGRLLAVGFWAIAATFLWRFARRHFSREAALFAVFAYAFMPLGIFYSRAFQPETLLHALCIASLDLTDRWLRTGKTRWYLGALLALSLAVMVKLPVYLVFPMLVLPLAYRGWTALKDYRLWLLALIPIAAGGAWYRHARHLAEIGTSFSLVGNKWMSWALATDLNGFWLNMLGRIAGLTLGPIAFVMLLMALRQRAQNPGQMAAKAYFWGVLAFTLTFAYGHVVHDYYQMPWLPPAALLVGGVWAGVLSRRPKLALTLAALMPLLGFATVWGHYQPRTLAWNNLPVYQAGLHLKQVTPPDSLVFVADEGSHLPEVFYFGERRGWHATLESLAPEHVADHRARGAAYLVLTSELGEKRLGRYLTETPLASWLEAEAHLIGQGDAYRIYALPPR